MSVQKGTDLAEPIALTSHSRMLVANEGDASKIYSLFTIIVGFFVFLLYSAKASETPLASLGLWWSVGPSDYWSKDMQSALMFEYNSLSVNKEYKSTCESVSTQTFAVLFVFLTVRPCSRANSFAWKHCPL